MPLKDYMVIDPYAKAIQYTGDNYNEIKALFGDLVKKKSADGFEFKEYTDEFNFCEPGDYIVVQKNTGEAAVFEEEQFLRDFKERIQND